MRHVDPIADRKHEFGEFDKRGIVVLLERETETITPSCDEKIFRQRARAHVRMPPSTMRAITLEISVSSAAN
jgi:hypothetical protein